MIFSVRRCCCDEGAEENILKVPHIGRFLFMLLTSLGALYATP